MRAETEITAAAAEYHQRSAVFRTAVFPERTTMNRVIRILLAAMMLAAIILQAACAETITEEPVLYAVDEALAADWAQMLGLEKKLSNTPGNTENLLKCLASPEAPDFFMTRRFIRIRAAGAAAPFEPTPRMKEEIASMPRFLQDVIEDCLTAEDGRLLAYPYSIDMMPMGYTLPDAWADSPFRNMTPPASFEEFLDFLEVYLETPHEGFCLFSADGEERDARTAVETLMKCRALQYRSDGKPVTFNDPEFIRLLERTAALAGRAAAAEADPEGRPLFTDGCSEDTDESGSSRLTWACLIPWRLTADQLPLVQMLPELYCVRSGSPFADRAAEFLERIIAHRDDSYRGEPNTEAYLYINPDKVNVAEENSLPREADGEQQYDLLMTQAYVDSVRDIHKYAVPTIADNDCINPESKYAGGKYTLLLDRFLEGKLTAAEFAAEWDRMNGEGGSVLRSGE